MFYFDRFEIFSFVDVECKTGHKVFGSRMEIYYHVSLQKKSKFRALHAAYFQCVMLLGKLLASHGLRHPHSSDHFHSGLNAHMCTVHVWQSKF